VEVSDALIEEILLLTLISLILLVRKINKNENENGNKKNKALERVRFLESKIVKIVKIVKIKAIEINAALDDNKKTSIKVTVNRTDEKNLIYLVSKRIRYKTNGSLKTKSADVIFLLPATPLRAVGTDEKSITSKELVEINANKG